MDRKIVYKLIEKFDLHQWEEFTHSFLTTVSDEELEELKAKLDRKELTLKQHKFETVMRWQKNCKINDGGKLLKTLYVDVKEFLLRGIPDEMELNVSKVMFAEDDALGDVDSDRSFSYPLSKNGGLVLIICNSFRTNNEFTSRNPGCGKDAEKMFKLWKETLECQLVDDKIHRDKTAAEMRVLLRNMGSSTKKYDYVVVVISTHGGLRKAKDEHTNPVEIIYGNDGEEVPINEIQSIYRNEDATNLQGIPKLFILQYCRGHDVDFGVKVTKRTETDAKAHSTTNLNEDESSESEQQEENLVSLIPSVSDIVTAYPTHLSFAALRNPDGSWFIDFVYEEFTEHFKTKHVTDMLTRVNNRMKTKKGTLKSDKPCKAMSIFESSLTRDFYLWKPDQNT